MSDTLPDLPALQRKNKQKQTNTEKKNPISQKCVNSFGKTLILIGIHLYEKNVLQCRLGFNNVETLSLIFKRSVWWKIIFSLLSQLHQRPRLFLCAGKKNSPASVLLIDVPRTRILSFYLFICYLFSLSRVLFSGFLSLEVQRETFEWLVTSPERSAENALAPVLTLLALFAGTSVATVTATDADDQTYGNSAKLVYSILQGQPYFSVDSENGEPASAGALETRFFMTSLKQWHDKVDSCIMWMLLQGDE